MLIYVLQQRNEAWSEEDVLRARQVELEQQLVSVEEYNDHLHEEVHQLHNQLHPFPKKTSSTLTFLLEQQRWI
jgi:uncharacterized protein YlxW (UPF0749 family)